ncbi:MAG: hypothetical protein WB037_24115 [Pseudolabrys sp.]|jgi:hypothetical protein
MNNSNSQTSKSPIWDWPYWMKGSVPNPLDVFAAPQNLEQSILPGWVFGGVVNVTEQNSSAPNTEREIIAKQSYGRQLGRIMDALVVLIAEQQKEGRKAKAFDKFMELDREINAIKTQAAASRLEHVIADLATLKENEPKEYDRIAATLRHVLKGQ